MTLASAINVHVLNTAVTNRTNLQTAINAGDCSIQFDEVGQYLFDRTLVIDTANACTLDGMGTGNLYMNDSAGLGGGLFEWVTNTTSTGPQRVLNFKQLSSAGTYMIGDVGRVMGSTTVKTCTVAGTSRTISVTGNVTNGSASVTNISSITKLLEGDYLSIGGATYLVKTIDASNPTITLGSNYAGATATGVAVVNSNPTWV